MLKRGGSPCADVEGAESVRRCHGRGSRAMVAVVDVVVGDAGVEVAAREAACA